MKKFIVFATLILLAATAFAQTEADFGVTLTEDGTGVVITTYTGKILAVRIPATIQGMPVKEIGYRAFAYFASTDGITSVIIPAGVTKIGQEAFNLQTKLASVTIPDSIAEIGSRAFENCFILVSVVLPKSLTVLKSDTFRGCGSLTSVILPEGLTEIESDAFVGCEKLASIKIPNSVTTIGSEAFQVCRALTSVTIGSGIENIGSNAFAYCSSLTTVTIPATVEKVTFNDGTNGNYGAFSGCLKLTLASQAALKRVGYTGGF
jgi:hypothetical protein